MQESRERIRAVREGREGLTSPRMALRRLLLLSEGRQFREAAAVVSRLGPSVLRAVATELPLDLLVEALPHSAYLLEALFCRLTTVGSNPRPDLQTDTVVWHLVRLFGAPHDSALRQRCGKLGAALGAWQPELRDTLKARRRALDKAVQGLGVHGLTADQSGSLVSLHVGLKVELQRHIETYKAAIHKLDELSPITVSQDPAQSSHQRLLAISHADIQQRLIDNKTLLTLLDKPALQQLRILVENLAQRVQNDKEVLFCVGQIRRVDSGANVEARPAAGILMNFSRGCDAVLGLMGPPTAPPSPGGTSCSSDGYHSGSETILDESNDLVRRYGSLYSRTRADTLEALDGLPQLKHALQLKSKILFSVVVLAFRACLGLRERKLSEVRRILCATESGDSSTVALDRAVSQHLLDTSESFPMGEAERLVANQVLLTLHEYPCLETCVPLLHYISASVRLGWLLVNQSKPYSLDTDFTQGLLRPDRHERHSNSDRRSDVIRGFLWPALLQNGRCVHKAIVIT